MNDHRTVLVALAFFVLLSFSSPALSQADSGDAVVQNVTYTGDATVGSDAEDLQIWRDGPHEFTVNLSSDSGLDGGTVCLLAVSDDARSESELSCRSVSVQADSSVAVTIGFDAWPTNLTGDQAVLTAVRSPDGERLGERSMDVAVLERAGDIDEDGLTNLDETTAGADLRRNDTDADGLDDGPEVHAYETDPTLNDTDGDSLLDRAEIETHQTDPTSADTDDDGLLDGVEVANGTSPNVADTDGDGLDDALEVNTYGTNATAPDSDDDGLDDASEVRDHGTNPTQSDTDDDGLQDNLEIHTYGTDPNAIDSDGDGLQDGIEVTKYRTKPTNSDTDGDGLLDGSEVNTHQTNPTNSDTDGDGLDDAAEVNRYETDPLSPDTDDDGVSDPQEVDRMEYVSPEQLEQLAAAGTLVVVLLGVGLYRTDRPVAATLRRVLPASVGRVIGESESATTDDGEGGTTHTDAEPDTATETDHAPSGQSIDDAALDDAFDGTPTATEQPDEPAEVEFDLLPNSEVILAVLDDNGGQIRQSELVEETGWSKAKVSRVLSKMEGEDQIVKVSVGRGNLITTPNDVPSGVQSPFED